MLTRSDTAREVSAKVHDRDRHRARLHPLLAALGLVSSEEPVPGLSHWRRGAGARPPHGRAKRVR